MKQEKKWEMLGMSTSWFGPTKVLLEKNLMKRMVLVLGCQLQGYKYWNDKPTIVGAVADYFNPKYYNEKVAPEAHKIIDKFLETHNLDDIYQECKCTEKNEKVLKWEYTE